MVKDNNVTKIAITGNTKLTLKSMKMITNLNDFKILYVFGLPDNKLESKVNSVKLNDFCEQNSIMLDKTNDWQNCLNFCEVNEIDLIVTLGDSRIVPKTITSRFQVIGNHGAILPNVQGGASLVWGRMLESYKWGISIMRIEGRVDSGEILKTKEFEYNSSTTEHDFVREADSLTVDALREVLLGENEPKENKHWDVRISKHTDSYKVYQIFQYCAQNNLNIYLPPRTPQDGIVKEEWPEDFKTKFKKACNKPYPKWSVK